MGVSSISYLTAWSSRDVIVLGHQQLTRAWWQDASESFDIFVSELVYDEASKGDPQAASERLRFLENLQLLTIEDEALELAAVYQRDIPLPLKAKADSLHLAIAALSGMDYLLTWNCAHMAHGRVKSRLAEINALRGLPNPVICTPEELYNEDTNLD